MLKRIKEYAIEYAIVVICLGGLLYSTTTAYKASFDIESLGKQQASVEKTLGSINNNIKEMRLILAKDKLKKGDLSQEELDQLWSKLEDEERTALAELKELSDINLRKKTITKGMVTSEDVIIDDSNVYPSDFKEPIPSERAKRIASLKEKLASLREREMPALIDTMLESLKTNP